MEQAAGFIDCPSGCDSESGITEKSSNVRDTAQLKMDAEKTREK